jgi:hypothetical protein
MMKVYSDYFKSLSGNNLRPLISGTKRLELETDHSHPFCVDVRDGWSFAFTPPYLCMSWGLDARTTEVVTGNCVWFAACIVSL